MADEVSGTPRQYIVLEPNEESALRRRVIMSPVSPSDAIQF